MSENITCITAILIGRDFAESHVLKKNAFQTEK